MKHIYILLFSQANFQFICIFYFSSHGVYRVFKEFNKQQFVNWRLTKSLEQY